MITGFSLTPASGSEREAVWEITKRISGLLIGDKGYLSSQLQQDLSKQSLNLQTPKRSNLVESRDRYSVRLLVKTRRLIETSSGELRRASHGGVPTALIGQLTERFCWETVKARDLWHLTSRINRKLLAHTVALWLNRPI